MNIDKPYTKTNCYVAIMAGGAGLQHWISPGSATDKTILQATAARFEQFVPLDQLYVITTCAAVKEAKNQLPKLPEENILGEPDQKSTAACVAYFASKIAALNPEANVIFAPSDHLIPEMGLFQRTCEAGLHFTEKYKVIALLGVQPSYPSEKHGYIQCGYEIVGDEQVHEAFFFAEKPGRLEAENLVASGNYLWSTGIMIGQAAAFLRAIEIHQPVLFSLFKKISYSMGTELEPLAIRQAYPKCPEISFDYAVLEHLSNFYVIPCSFGWFDMENAEGNLEKYG